MKTLKIILSLIFSLTFFACEDKNVFPDPMTMPIKALDLNVEILNLYTLSDGRAAALINVNDKMKEKITGKDAYQLAIIDKNGNYTLSDVMYFLELDEDEIAQTQLYESSSGEIFINFQIIGITYTNIVKLDKDGHIIYSKDDEGVERESDGIYSYNLYTMFDNGEIADLSYNLEYDYEDDEIVDSFCFLNIINNYGDKKNLYFPINGDYYWTHIFSFEDKLCLYKSRFSIYFYINEQNLENDDYGYIIANNDGTTIKSGSLSSPISDIKYINGYIYVVTMDETSLDLIVPQWNVTKMDTNGEIISTSDKIQASYLSPNFTVHDGKLIIPGAVLTDETSEDGIGVIYMLDDNTGNLTDSIALSYNNMDVMPSVISPDNNGEYDVFALVRHDYDDWNDFKNGSSVEMGKVFIYHTDDLHKFNVND